MVPEELQQREDGGEEQQQGYRSELRLPNPQLRLTSKPAASRSREGSRSCLLADRRSAGSGWRGGHLAQPACPAAPSVALPRCVETQGSLLAGKPLQRLDRKEAVEQAATQNHEGDEVEDEVEDELEDEEDEGKGHGQDERQKVDHQGGEDQQEVSSNELRLR